jgi:hypothetical protein
MDFHENSYRKTSKEKEEIRIVKHEPFNQPKNPSNYFLKYLFHLASAKPKGE